MNSDTPVLALEGVSKSFGPVQALNDVDFEVHAGEVVALVGDNGAGKSTLVKTIAGIHPPDAGTISFEGSEVTIHGPADAVDLGIATVYQDLALCDNLDVVENLFLGREEKADGPAGYLGQLQQVAIARSLRGEPKLVRLDEPTAALGVRQTAQVLELVKRPRERGYGVVVISHNLADVFEVADRIYVLRLGREAGDFKAGEASQDQVVAAITGSSGNGGGQR